jgi:hypothetical protein
MQGRFATSTRVEHWFQVIATGVCRLSIAAIFRQPSILRNFICPLATEE